MIKDYFKFAFRGISNRRIRSWLTMIGIFIGIAAVVALISIGQGMQNAINEQFESMGADKVTVQPGSGMMGAPGSGESVASLTEHDKGIIEKVRGIDLVGGFIMKSARIEFNDEVKYSQVLGLPTDETRRIIEDMQDFEVVDGRDLKKTDNYNVIIGYNLAHNDFFDNVVKVRDKIEIEGKEFKVIGSLKKIGNSMDDTSVAIPLDTAREIFGEPDEFSVIIARTERGFNPSDVAEDIKKAMRKDRDQEKGEEDFTVATFEQIMESFNIILNVVQAVLIGIAAISLLVGGIGIMNTMYTSVLERTREIGIMKAIGARNRDVLSIFLMESGLLGLAGGAIGVLLGMGLAKTVEIVAVQALGTTLLKASFPGWLIFGALAFSFVIGCLSGVLPARQASKLKPVDALRHE